jgi:hypothetical protein
MDKVQIKHYSQIESKETLDKSCLDLMRIFCSDRVFALRLHTES